MVKKKKKKEETSDDLAAARASPSGFTETVMSGETLEETQPQEATKLLITSTHCCVSTTECIVFYSNVVFFFQLK